MAGKGLGYGCAEHDAPGAGSGGCENAEAVSPAGAAAGHPSRANAAIIQVLHRSQGGVAVGGRYHHADSLLGHIYPIKLMLTSEYYL